jgi:hypothetical protein
VSSEPCVWALIITHQSHDDRCLAIPLDARQGGASLEALPGTDACLREERATALLSVARPILLRAVRDTTHFGCGDFPHRVAENLRSRAQKSSAHAERGSRRPADRRRSTGRALQGHHRDGDPTPSQSQCGPVVGASSPRPQALPVVRFARRGRRGGRLRPEERSHPVLADDLPAASVLVEQSCETWIS